MRTNWFSRLLVITLLLEIGVVLIAVPWSVYWERNIFFDLAPALREPLQNQFTRGAVSGIGVVDLCAGLFELGSFVLGGLLGSGRRTRARVSRPEGGAAASSREDDRRPVSRVVRSPTSDAG